MLFLRKRELLVWMLWERFLERYRTENALHGAFHQEKPHFIEADRQIDREIASDDTVKGDMEIANKRVVLVTGASSGIGLACATHLAGRGFRVYGTSRRAAAGTPGDVTMLAADVTDDRSV